MIRLSAICLASAVNIGNSAQQTASGETTPVKAKVQQAMPLFTDNKYLAGIDNGKQSFRWDHTPAELEKLTESLIAEATEFVDELVHTEHRTAYNTLTSLAKFESDQATVAAIIDFHSSVSPDKELRDKSTQLSRQYQEHMSQLYRREDFYKALIDFRNHSQSIETEWAWETFEPVEQRFINKVIHSMERDGLKLDELKRNQLAEIEKEIADLESKAMTHVTEDKTKVEASVDKLEGLTDEILKSLENGANNHKFISMKPNEIQEAMRLIKDADERRQLATTKDSFVQKKNEPLLNKIVILRSQMAKLLGYHSYSGYALEEQMAKNPDTVENFLEDLISRVYAKGETEMHELVELKQKDLNDTTAKIDPWDVSYYSDIQKRQNHQVDEAELKEYFPADHIVDETMKIYQELLGVKFEQVECQAWQEDVTCHQVFDASSKQFLGQFYLDLYVRDGKYNHAACFTLQSRSVQANDHKFPVAAMVVNFDKPTEEGSSTMLYSNVRTFFHEFGHVMHELLSEVNFKRFAGTNVEGDFVELPSQMLENWVKDPSILRRLGRHHKTGKQIPDDLIENKLASMKANEGLSTLGQLFQASYDFILHSADEKSKNQKGLINQVRSHMKRKGDKIDTKALWHQLKPKLTFTQAIDGTNPATSWDHIIDGYESRYYGYQWSLVYSFDLFTEFEKNGIMNPEVGAKYRSIVLAQGGSKDAFDIIKEFLGREPSNQAYLEKLGFVDAGSEAKK